MIYCFYLNEPLKDLIFEHSLICAMIGNDKIVMECGDDEYLISILKLVADTYILKGTYEYELAYRISGFGGFGAVKDYIERNTTKDSINYCEFLYLGRQFKFTSIDYIVKNKVGELTLGSTKSIPMYMGIYIGYDDFHKVEQSPKEISNEDDLYICKKAILLQSISDRILRKSYTND